MWNEMDDETKEKCEKWKIVTNWPEGMEYRILITPEYGKTEMLQDFSEDAYIEIPQYADGVYTVVSRHKNNPDCVNTLQVYY